MKASKLIAELQALVRQHGDRQVVTLEGCEPVSSAFFSEDSEAQMGSLAPIYLNFY